RRQAGRRAVRGRPAPRPPPRARAEAADGLRHLQRRPGARELPLQELNRPRDPRQGRLLPKTGARRRTRPPLGTDQAARGVGIPIEYHHHEVAPSQHEIDMRYAPALDMADYTVTYRLIVKEVAAKHGAYATFMPKPLFGENGSGMHTHMSLFKDGRNQFYSQD